jgi:glutamate-1-semialdehyde aminotransferase/malonyl CoA-acyl carrier protein transacylase
VGAVEGVIRGQGIAAKPLATSHAFHSPMMDPIVEAFADAVSRVPRRAPRLPFLSCLTGDWITDEAATDPLYWARQLRQPVRFLDMAARLVAPPERALLEVGPGRTLATLVRQQPGRPTSQAVVTSLDAGHEGIADPETMLLAAGRLWIAGADLDWAGLHGRDRRRRVPLPTYPFERKRHWVDSVEAASDAHTATPATFVATATGTPDREDEGSMAQASTIALSAGRRAELVTRLQTLFAEMSGIGAADLDPAVSLLELGLDSLVLTQASSRIQKTFGVKVSFRDLLDEASTLDALAARIDQQLPPDLVARRPGSPAPAAAVTTAPASPAALLPLVLAGDGGSMSGSAVVRLVAQQLELMSRQLEMLRSAGIAENASTQALDDPPSKPPATTVARPPRPRVEGPTERGTVAFGPYRPPAKGPTGGLTPRQEQGLKKLVDLYTRRTPGSKRLTTENRPHLADPRTVAGFRLMWKEMVYPIATVRSAGSKLWDVDGNEYVDLTNGFGMILFGHNPPFVREAIEAQMRQGIEIGPQTPLAGEVARLVSELTGMERVAFCNTGSEAVMAAVRVARTVTGRDKIAMFTGAYHGVFDEVLVRPAGGRDDPRSMPIAPGIPPNMVESIVVLDYGSQEASLRVLEARGPELAAVLGEPVQSRRPELQPVDFLRELRAVTEKTQTALVFDEVVSGFRVHPGGTQAAFGIRADIATYGKVVGGGLPIGLVAGRAAYLDALDGGQWRYGDESFPEVGVTFFAGTFVRHPLALAAARAVLLHLKSSGPELQRELNLRTSTFVGELNACAERAGAPVRLTHFSSWFCFNFPPDVPHTSLFYAWMRAKGVHVWEGRAGFLTTAHTDADLDHVCRAFAESIEEMQEAGFLPRSVPEPPVAGARLGKDASGRDAWFVPDPERPGKFLQVGEEVESNA